MHKCFRENEMQYRILDKKLAKMERNLNKTKPKSMSSQCRRNFSKAAWR